MHAPTRLPLDIVLGGPGLEDLFLERAVRQDVEGVAVPVASAADLIVMKVLAARPKDLEDVAAILSAQRTSLDFDYVRATLTALEQTLGQSDLSRAFDAVHARATRR